MVHLACQQFPVDVSLCTLNVTGLNWYVRMAVMDISAEQCLPLNHPYSYCARRVRMYSFRLLSVTKLVIEILLAHLCGHFNQPLLESSKD